jgi:hypothetical protein
MEDLTDPSPPEQCSEIDQHYNKKTKDLLDNMPQNVPELDQYGPLQVNNGGKQICGPSWHLVPYTVSDQAFTVGKPRPLFGTPLGIKKEGFGGDGPVTIDQDFQDKMTELAKEIKKQPRDEDKIEKIKKEIIDSNYFQEAMERIQFKEGNKKYKQGIIEWELVLKIKCINVGPSPDFTSNPNRDPKTEFRCRPVPNSVSR